LEVLVVADGDTDGSADLAARFNADVFQLPHKGGPARARNHGAFRAQGEILLFIDADVALAPDFLHRLAEVLRGAPDTAAVIGSYDSEPAAESVISQYKNLLHHYVHQYSREEAATFWGACGAIKREIFLAMGGFDERYRRPCVEDIELGYRLRAAGHRILLQRTLQVKHLKRWTFASLLKSDIWDRALPWTELILRYRVFRNDLNLRHSDRLSVAAAPALVFTTTLALWRPFWIAMSGGLACMLLFLNWPMYRFFKESRGKAFAAAAIVLHWLSLLYSSMAFTAGLVWYGIAPWFRRGLGWRSHRSREPELSRPLRSLITGLGKSKAGGT
jgi:GT2 family glycosyltransferase